VIRNKKQVLLLDRLLITDSLAPHPIPPRRSLRSRGEGDVPTQRPDGPTHYLRLSIN
jgi:hypothetical protein